ncbi:MAG TPA: DUF6518 family protein [Candidatus Saccharimonadales bacterium]
MNKLLKLAVTTTFVGILLGVFTSFGQSVLPSPFTQLANSYSMWLIFSFGIGYALKSHSSIAVAIVGAIVQYLAILLYYIVSAVRFDLAYTIMDLISANLVWIIGGTLVGPIAAVAGRMTANKTKLTDASVSFMAGLIVSESGYQFIKLGYGAEGVVFATVVLIYIGAMYYLVKYRITATLLYTLVWSVAMYIGYVYVLGSIFS